MHVPATQHPTTERRRLFARALLSGLCGQVVNLGLRFAITPLLIAHLGLPAIGFWSLAFLVLAVLGVQRTGFVSGAVPVVASAMARGERDTIERLLRTSATVGLLLAATLGTALLAFAAPIASGLGCEAAGEPAAAAVLRLITLATFVALVFGGWQTLLEAGQHHGLVRTIDTVAGLLEVGLLLVLVHLDAGIHALAIAYAVRLLLPLPLFAWFSNRRLGRHRIGPGRPDRASLRTLWRNGAPLQLLGIVHVAIGGLDRLALGHFVSLAAAGSLEVARKLVQVVNTLCTQGLGPLVPALAELAVRDRSRLPLVVRQATFLLVLTSTVPLAVLGFAADAVVAAWLGHADANITTCVRCLCLGTIPHLATGPTTALLRGTLAPASELRSSLLWLLAAVATVPAAACAWGAPGAAAAAAATQAFANLTLLWRNWPRLGIQRRELLPSLLLPALLAALPTALAVPLAVAASETRIGTLLALATATLASAAVALGLAWLVHSPLRRSLRRGARGCLPVQHPPSS